MRFSDNMRVTVELQLNSGWCTQLALFHIIRAREFARLGNGLAPAFSEIRRYCN